MRVAAFVIALVGMAIGVMTGTYQISEHNFYVWVTMGFSAAGAIGGILLLLRWRYAPWLLIAVAVLGAIPDSILWEGAGSCFLVSALIGFTSANHVKGA